MSRTMPEILSPPAPRSRSPPHQSTSRLQSLHVHSQHLNHAFTWQFERPIHKTRHSGQSFRDNGFPCHESAGQLCVGVVKSCSIRCFRLPKLDAKREESLSPCTETAARAAPQGHRPPPQAPPSPGPGPGSHAWLLRSPIACLPPAFQWPGPGRRALAGRLARHALLRRLLGIAGRLGGRRVGRAGLRQGRHRGGRREELGDRQVQRARQLFL